MGEVGTQHRFSQTPATRIGEALLQDAIVEEPQLSAALEFQEQNGGFLGEAFVQLGLVRPAIVGKYLSDAMGFPYIDLALVDIDAELSRGLPEEFVRRKQVLPFARQGDEVLVAMADPLNVSAVDEVRSRLKQSIIPVLSFSFDVEDAINRAFTVQRRSESLLAELGEATGEEMEEELASLALNAPIVRLVDGILEAASRTGASDIHIEPSEKIVRVRFRIDGLLYEQMTLPRANMAAVTSRIKIIAGMNIAERRRPQDGRFAYSNSEVGEFDVRASCMNTIHGEKIALRLLPKAKDAATTKKLGFLPDQLQTFESFIERPHGVILVTGPTGSGKSTTMFAALQRINDPSLNISTIEDPVEYKLAGTNQVQVNPRIGVTFASGLRTLVRQDPDVIMVGEIRDAETAEIAIQAALTGHLVLSTLHTNDAPGSIVRLQNMGIEPFLISSAIVGVIGQRLIRTVCPSCKEMVSPSAEIVDQFGLASSNGVVPMIAKGRGCVKCGDRGLRGRTAVCEIMPMTDGIRELTLKKVSSAKIAELAISEGMMTMREAGIRKVIEGVTTPEEIGRVLYTED